eukprot:s2818_g4.t1
MACVLPGPGPANFGPPPQSVHSGIQYPGMAPPSFPVAGPPNFMARPPASRLTGPMALLAEAVALGAPARPALPGCRQASVPARAAREEPGQGASGSALAAVATGMVAGVVARRGSRFTQKRASASCQAVKLAPGAWPAETITHPSEVAQPPEDAESLCICALPLTPRTQVPKFCSADAAGSVMANAPGAVCRYEGARRLRHKECACRGHRCSVGEVCPV